MSTFQIPDGTKVQMSKKELIFGDTIVMARESNDILADTEALRQRIEEDGYLIIRNFHNRDDLMKGRKDIVDYMESQGVLAPGSTLENAIIGPQNRSTRFRDNVVKTWSDFLNIVEGKNTMDFFGRFLGDPALSLDHKWVRAVSTGRNAGMHCDIVYMGAGRPWRHSQAIGRTPVRPVRLDRSSRLGDRRARSQPARRPLPHRSTPAHR